MLLNFLEGIGAELQINSTVIKQSAKQKEKAEEKGLELRNLRIRARGKDILDEGAWRAGPECRGWVGPCGPQVEFSGSLCESMQGFSHLPRGLAFFL